MVLVAELLVESEVVLSELVVLMVKLLVESEVVLSELVVLVVKLLVESEVVLSELVVLCGASVVLVAVDEVDDITGAQY